MMVTGAFGEPSTISPAGPGFASSVSSWASAGGSGVFAEVCGVAAGSAKAKFSGDSSTPERLAAASTNVLPTVKNLRRVIDKGNS